MDYTKESIQYEFFHCLQGTIGQGVVHMMLVWSPPGQSNDWANLDSRPDRGRPAQDEAGGPLSRSPIK